MGLVDDRPQFLVRIVLRASLAGQRHHTAGNAHLDQLGAMLDLIAHRLADLVDPVGDALLDGQLERTRHERREHRRVEVATCGCDRVPGGDHARAFDPSRVDGLAERDVEQVTACLDEQSEIAHRGEPRTQRAPRIADRAQHPDRGIVLHLGQAGGLAAAAHQEVDLHVHQAGQQDRVAQVDDLSCRLTPDADNPILFDADDARPDDLAGVNVE